MIEVMGDKVKKISRENSIYLRCKSCEARIGIGNTLIKTRDARKGVMHGSP